MSQVDHDATFDSLNNPNIWRLAMHKHFPPQTALSRYESHRLVEIAVHGIDEHVRERMGWRVELLVDDEGVWHEGFIVIWTGNKTTVLHVSAYATLAVINGEPLFCGHDGALKDIVGAIVRRLKLIASGDDVAPTSQAN